MHFIIYNPTSGYLVDFDPYGKPDYIWSDTPKEAWVFGTMQEARVARRWLRDQVRIKGIIRKSGRVIVIELSGGHRG